MTEQQIKRAKRLAEIQFSKESYYVQERGGAVWVCHISGAVWKPFNPEQDKALLWDLQIKYGVQINMKYYQCLLLDYPDYNWGVTEVASFCFKDISEIPAALIDCVIEINGGYDD